MSHAVFLPAYYVRAGADVTFAAADADEAVELRWRCNGRELPGATGPTLALANVGTTASGTYSIVAANGDGETAADVATLTVVAETRFTGFAAAGRSGEGAHALLLGFVIDGAGGKQVCLSGGARACLSRPEISLIGESPIGDLPLPPGAEETTLVTRLETGGYTLRVAAANGVSPSAHAAIADSDAGERSGSAIVNASARGEVDPECALQLTFRVAGTTAATVLIRGIGPSLRSLFGLAEALDDVRLELRDDEGSLLDSNEGWRSEPLLHDAFARCGAFGLTDGSADAALLLTIPPGEYRARLAPAGNHRGIGLIEVYEVPSQ